MEYIWTTTYCEYTSFEVEPPGQVKVTTLHWTCVANEGELTASEYGSVYAADQNRVYPLPALEAVPEHVMTGWVQEAMGEEAVQATEDNLAKDIAEQQDPVDGGFSPQTEEELEVTQ